ncbi:hypothetical protein C162_00260 [Paenibacillus sp. FSL R7-269]|uniref:hypothetical protein n=1 Tax=Paenibacillus sp. FSL R7-269 TaxID=1226755 RepID=UPI0003E253B0|nr:hypothetical protein [Paenibacillus sp. FSL R7-269]ETT56798.1 hypothetical protein C162_00260 [Paenibacillus sp. FSL R7-269]
MAELFNYVDAPITQLLASDNGLHDHLAQRSLRGRLLNFRNTPCTTFKVLDVAKIKAGNMSLKGAIALHSAALLREMGLPLPIGIERQYAQSLVDSYLLNSSLCYVETIRKGQKESYFATKSSAVYKAMLPELVKTRRYVDYTPQFTPTHEELKTGNFNVMKMALDYGGFHVSQQRLRAQQNGTIIIPMYAIAHYIDYLISLMHSGAVEVEFMENGVARRLLTSLHCDVLAQAWGLDNAAVEKVQGSWQNAFHFGELILPVLKRPGKFATVQVYDILNIKNR